MNVSVESGILCGLSVAGIAVGFALLARAARRTARRRRDLAGRLFEPSAPHDRGATPVRP